MDYANEEFTILLQELSDTVRQTNPPDILQFCANFFFSKLSQDRAGRYLDYYQRTSYICNETESRCVYVCGYELYKLTIRSF